MQALADSPAPCKHAKDWGDKGRIFRLGKKCEITGQVCFNYNKPAAVATCSVRPKGKEAENEPR